MAETTPDNIEAIYTVDITELDQGSTGKGNSLKDIITAIGIEKTATIFFPHYISNGNNSTYTILTSIDLTAYSNIILKFAPGALLLIDNGVTVTIYAPTVIDTHNQNIFSGLGSVIWANPGTVKQAWFGITNAALIMGVASLIDGSVWYLATGIYTQTTAIILPDGASMKGDGPQHTIINSAVPSAYAITVQSSNTYTFKSFIENFKIIGNSTNDTGSTGIGGIKFDDTDYCKVKSVWAEGFCEGGWATAGDPSTESTYAGFEISGTVEVILENCMARRNDVGVLTTKGTQSVATNIRLRDTSMRLNRTHAIKIEDTMTFTYDGGIIESNNGLYTMRILASPGVLPTAITLTNIHFESNQRISGAGVVGSRDIYATGFQGVPIQIINNHFGVGATYPEIAIELSDTRNPLISGNMLGSGLNATYSIKLQSDVESALIIGNYLSKGIDDDSIGLTMISNNSSDLVLSDAADMAGVTPSQGFGVYKKLPAVTVTNILYALSGRVLILEGQSGTVLSGSNFVLKNGCEYMHLSLGSISILRKDQTSGKWVMLSHTPTSTPGSFINSAIQNIDDRPIWYCGDVASSPISTINFGYDTQEITIISEHTGSNTTTFEDGTGNLSLAGAFIMGLDNTLKLLYRKSTNKWHEISRSSN